MAIEDDVRFLERAPFLRLCGKDALRVIAISAEPQAVKSGEVLFRKGEQAEAGYIVVDGSIALHASEDAPPRDIAGAGTLLSELALIAETTHNMTAIADQASKVIRLPRRMFLKVLEGYPEAALRLRDHVHMNAERMMRDLQSLGTSIATREAEG